MVSAACDRLDQPRGRPQRRTAPRRYRCTRGWDRSGGRHGCASGSGFTAEVLDSGWHVPEAWGGRL